MPNTTYTATLARMSARTVHVTLPGGLNAHVTFGHDCDIHAVITALHGSRWDHRYRRFTVPMRHLRTLLAELQARGVEVHIDDKREVA